MADTYSKNSTGKGVRKEGLKETTGRDTGTGSSSIIKRGHGTRPFTGDLKKHAQ